MKTTKQRIDENLVRIKNLVTGSIMEEDEGIAIWFYYEELIGEMMREYAKDILVDYDNWKAHKTPDLVKQYIKEKGL